MKGYLHARYILSISLVFITVSTFIYLTNFIPSFGQWYSYDQTFRLQINAFLKGELAIQPVPYGHRHDWAWGNGMHHVWRLGVPLIQLPFEVAARAFGFFGFPDRFIFIIFYSVVGFVYWQTLETLIPSKSTSGSAVQYRILFIPLFFFTFLYPAFIVMIKARFNPYEEIIAYGYIWILLLFAIFRLFITKLNPITLLAACLVAGFSPNIRPTLGVYGIITFMMLLYIAQQNRVPLRWWGIPAFLVGNIFLALTNLLRFGKPFEMGHSLGLMAFPLSDYICKFEDPMSLVPLWKASLELISAMFFFDVHKYYGLGQDMLWQVVEVRRIRELNFAAYDPLTLVLLFSGWVLALIAWFIRRGRDRDELIYFEISALWSFISFSLLFIFYSRFGAIASRYFIDFAPAIVIMLSILYIRTIRYLMDLRSYQGKWILIGLLFISCLYWPVDKILNALIAQWYYKYSKIEVKNVADAATARERVSEMRRITGPLLPSKYQCGDKEYLYEIPHNNSGWNISGDCRTELVSTHLLDNPQCLSLEFELIPYNSTEITSLYSPDEIEVKIGLDFLTRTSTRINGNREIRTYCLQNKTSYVRDGFSSIRLISIKWLDLKRHPKLKSPPLRFVALEKDR